MFVVSVFWSVMADLFSSAQGKRLFGVIASGGSLGAIIGPIVTATIVEDVGRGGILLLAAGLLTGSLLCLFRLIVFLPKNSVEQGKPKVIGGSILAGATLVFRDRYLGGIAAIILLFTLLQTFMYFQQIDLVGRFYGDQDPTRFFALVDAATSVISVTAQLFITARLLRWLGAARTLAIMPILTAIGFLLLSVAPGVVLLGVVQAIRRGGEYGLMKPARDLLFTRVDEESKYKAKNFIDTVVYRGGDLVSGWVYKGLNGGLRLPMEVIAAIAVPLSLLWAWLAHRLGKEFDHREEP
jgi:AAA family ATP:ADP antiporter